MPARRSPLLVVLCLVVLGATAVPAAFTPGENVRQLQFDGLDRSYRLHAPPAYDGSAPVPLVLDIHGWLSNAEQQEALSGMRNVADANGFLVAYPQGIRNEWNAGTCCGNAGIDEVGFLRAVVAAIEAEAPIDHRRVYVTGLSNGGAMTQRLACDASDMFAAAAPMAFPIPLKPVSECQPARSMPVLAVHGLTDQLVSYNGGGLGISAPASFAYWREMDACTGDPERVDRGQSYCQTYPTCANGVQVGLCSVVAQAFPGTFFSGHIVYLNPDFNVAQVAWDFLSQFTLPEEARSPAEAELTGPDRIKFAGVPRGARLAQLRWTVRLGKGTWGVSDGSGTALSGSWRRPKRGRTGRLVLTDIAAQDLASLVAARVADLTRSTPPALTVAPAGPLRVAFDRAGTPTSLRGRFRIQSGDPGGATGRYDLRLRRAR